MKKVVYSVQRLGKEVYPKTTGVGYITDRDLVIACLSQKDNPYIRVFDDAVKNCYTKKKGVTDIKDIILLTRIDKH